MGARLWLLARVDLITLLAAGSAVTRSLGGFPEVEPAHAFRIEMLFALPLRKVPQTVTKAPHIAGGFAT
jgi:hypothetical protein